MVAAEANRIAERYRRFAVREARGASEAYEALALGVAASRDILEFLASLPAERRQPNLFLAAVRLVGGVPANTADLTSLLRREHERIRVVMLSRMTQTNEPARCSVLLPVLAQLPQPLALIEVGASAGLCLLPDRYGYDYGTARIAPPSPAAPVFRCAVSGPAPLPTRVPRIVWRRGLDLNPIDPRSEVDVEWLRTLVWPGQEGRAHGLQQAIALARADPPIVVKGDLLTDLEPLIAAAPRAATLVVFHTAVLTYVPARERARFAERMRALPCVWLSNEAPEVFPDLAASAPPPPAPGRYLLMQNGVPLAWTGPHGQSLDWFAPGRGWINQGSP